MAWVGAAIPAPDGGDSARSRGEKRIYYGAIDVGAGARGNDGAVVKINDVVELAADVNCRQDYEGIQSESTGAAAVQDHHHQHQQQQQPYLAQVT